MSGWLCAKDSFFLSLCRKAAVAAMEWDENFSTHNYVSNDMLCHHWGEYKAYIEKIYTHINLVWSKWTFCRIYLKIHIIHANNCDWSLLQNSSRTPKNFHAKFLYKQTFSSRERDWITHCKYIHIYTIHSFIRP